MRIAKTLVPNLQNKGHRKVKETSYQLHNIIKKFMKASVRTDLHA